MTTSIDDTLEPAGLSISARPLLSVLIKALNEESRIGACIDSVQRALSEVAVSAEIVVADALSADATGAIAMARGARVVTLRDMHDRGCGSGMQLGYQASRGELVMFMDADMELEPGFLGTAIEALARNERLAGVAGQLIDTADNNWFDRKRIQDGRASSDCLVRSLGGGGLYRRSAIEVCGGYAGNRNLKAFEEAELGLRLRNGGWQLLRLAVPGVRHTGYTESSLGLIRRYWSARRMDAAGVLLRSSVYAPWCREVLRMFAHPLAVMAFWCATILCVFVFGADSFVVSGASAAFVFLLLAIKKRNLQDAAISVLLWHIAAVGLIRGFIVGPARDPLEPIEATYAPSHD